MSNDYRTGFGCDVCGGCPRCESDEEPTRGECEDCEKVCDLDDEAVDEGYDKCPECWARTTELWAEMDAADRYTRGAEGGWCDLGRTPSDPWD
jgi:hypothetical protein